MAATPEGRVKAKVKALLTKHGTWYFMPVSNGFGKHGIPDFVGCNYGRFFTVETKAPGKKPTPLQEMQMGQIAAAGGATFVIDGSDETIRSLETWLTLPIQ
jgi:hypothetical protein